MSKAKNFIEQFDEAMINVDAYMQGIKRPLTQVIYNWALPMARRWGHKRTSTDMLIRALNKEFMSGKYPMPIEWEFDDDKRQIRQNQRTRRQMRNQGITRDDFWLGDMLSISAMATWGGKIYVYVSPSINPQRVLDTLPQQVANIIAAIRHELIHVGQAQKIHQNRASSEFERGKDIGTLKPASGRATRYRRAYKDSGTGEKYTKQRFHKYLAQTNEIVAFAAQFVELFVRNRNFIFVHNKTIPDNMLEIYNNYSAFGINSTIYKRFIKLVMEEALRRGVDEFEIRAVISVMEKYPGN